MIFEKGHGSNVGKPSSPHVDVQALGRSEHGFSIAFGREIGVKQEIALSYHQLLISREIGGAGLVALHLAKTLSRRTEQCHIWIPGNGPAQRAADELALTSHEYDSTGVFSSGKVQSAVANWKFYRVLRDYRPGIIHVHSPICYGAVQRGLKLSRLKRIVHVHGEEEMDTLRWAFKYPPEMIVTCARYLVDYVRGSLGERYQRKQRIIAVPNAVDTEKFFPGDKDEAKRRTGAATDVPLILMLANLAPLKGQETAIRAVAELKKRGVHTNCWLAGVERGGGTYTAQLSSLISELDVEDRIRLLGYRSDAPDLLRAADFFLLPSTHEGLPLSILEAQASKLPVLTAPTGGIPELVSNGETGFLIHAGDYVGYSNSIQTLLSNRGLYEHVAENAYEQVKREYEWNTYCERIWEIYCELLANREETLRLK